MISLKLWYVPVTVPKKPSRIIREFLINTRLPGPLGVSDFTIISSKDGMIKANAVEHKEPINEMKSPNFGTASAIPTRRKEIKTQIS